MMRAARSAPTNARSKNAGGRVAGRRRGCVVERARQAVRGVRGRVGRRSEEGGVADAQGNDSDERGGIRVRRGDGGFFMDQRQGARVDSLRPDHGLEKMTATGNKRWYVVHAYSGFEKSVQRALEDRINRAGMNDKFGKILVPVEEVVEMKGGQKIGRAHV